MRNGSSHGIALGPGSVGVYRVFVFWLFVFLFLRCLLYSARNVIELPCSSNQWAKEINYPWCGCTRRKVSWKEWVGMGKPECVIEGPVRGGSEVSLGTVQVLDGEVAFCVLR